MSQERENVTPVEPGTDIEIIEQDGSQDIIPAGMRAEIDMQIATARRYPRSIKRFKDEALALATLDEETATGCMYALPRGGKPIEGPSVRLAEIVVSAWGNIRADARVIDVAEKHITAEGLCWDLEKNVAVRVQVRRRITDKNGRRYSDDMIVVTGNAACSIALRNAVFKVIPHAITKTVYDAARKVAIGDAKTLVARRADLVGYFGKMGVKPEQLAAVVNRASIDDITLDDLAVLKGVATAIKDGETTVDQSFPMPPKITELSGRTELRQKPQEPSGSDQPSEPAEQPTPQPAATTASTSRRASKPKPAPAPEPEPEDNSEPDEREEPRPEPAKPKDAKQQAAERYEALVAHVQSKWPDESPDVCRLAAKDWLFAVGQTASSIARDAAWTDIQQRMQAESFRDRIEKARERFA